VRRPCSVVSWSRDLVDDACEKTLRIVKRAVPISKMRSEVPLTLLVLCVFGGAQEADITPAMGRKGTRCYDKFNKAQVRTFAALGRRRELLAPIQISGNEFFRCARRRRRRIVMA
jgi:hypothetical protein